MSEGPLETTAEGVKFVYRVNFPKPIAGFTKSDVVGKPIYSTDGKVEVGYVCNSQFIDPEYYYTYLVLEVLVFHKYVKGFIKNCLPPEVKVPRFGL